jgi:glycosyltransferase involved in cell wall biosynthesis
MKTIHFDARFIRLDRPDGISRFSSELAKALSRKVHLVVLIHDLRQLESLPESIDYVVVNNPQSPAELFIANKLNRLGATHVFSPMQLMGSVGRKYKLILTLHDLIYYSHRKPPQDLNVLVRIIWRLYHLSYQPQRWLLNRADAIATVSKTTKTLMEKHRLTRKPITVVYNAPDRVVKSTSSSPETRNLVYIGSFMPYKNVETLVRGVGLLPGYTLHLLSKISVKRKNALFSLSEQVGASVVFHNGVTDEEYRAQLLNAFALVSASKDEGFGIPLVEAMQLGTPVVVSQLDIFSEVAGEAGTFFDPDRPESFSAAIVALQDHQQWKDKATLSISQAAMFDWDKSADALINQFDELDS